MNPKMFLIFKKTVKTERDKSGKAALKRKIICEMYFIIFKKKDVNNETTKKLLSTRDKIDNRKPISS